MELRKVNVTLPKKWTKKWLQWMIRSYRDDIDVFVGREGWFLFCFRRPVVGANQAYHILTENKNQNYDKLKNHQWEQIMLIIS